MTSAWNDFNDARQNTNLIPKGTITGRVAFAGKSMATGNWVSSFGASGTVSIMKQ